MQTMMSGICLTPAAYVEYMLWRSALQVLQRAPSAMTVHQHRRKMRYGIR